MKLKSLIQSKGESRVKTILEHRLARTPFQVAPKVRLASSIKWEPEEKGSPTESVRLFNYFTRAELDFVIFFRSSGFPFLAIEFDGRYHETDTKARERDILKNRICSMAGLPLLRVRHQEIQPLFTSGSSFLSYIVEIVRRYKMTDEARGYSPYHEIQRHDLAEIQRLRDKLAKKYSMFSSELAAKTPRARFAYEFGPPGADYASSETDVRFKSSLVLHRMSGSLPPKKWPAVHCISKELMLRTGYKTTAERRPIEPDLEAWAKWLEKKPFYSNIPGVHWLYVAWNILEAICLKQLLIDAEEGKLHV